MKKQIQVSVNVGEYNYLQEHEVYIDQIAAAADRGARRALEYRKENKIPMMRYRMATAPSVSGLNLSKQGIAKVNQLTQAALEFIYLSWLCIKPYLMRTCRQVPGMMSRAIDSLKKLNFEE